MIKECMLDPAWRTYYAERLAERRRRDAFVLELKGLQHRAEYTYICGGTAAPKTPWWRFW